METILVFVIILAFVIITFASIGYHCDQNKKKLLLELRNKKFKLLNFQPTDDQELIMGIVDIIHYLNNTCNMEVCYVILIDAIQRENMREWLIKSLDFIETVIENEYNGIDCP